MAGTAGNLLLVLAGNHRLKQYSSQEVRYQWDQARTVIAPRRYATKGTRLGQLCSKEVRNQGDQ